MRKHQGDAFMSPGPTARVDEKDYLEIKVNQGNLFQILEVIFLYTPQWPSKLGYSAFVSKTPRLSAPQSTKMPSVGSYDVESKKVFRRAQKPFNVGADRKDKEPFLTPA